MKVSRVQNNIDFHCMAFFPKLFLCSEKKVIPGWYSMTKWWHYFFFGWTVLLNKNTTGQTRNVNCENIKRSWFLVQVAVTVSDGASHQSVSIQQASVSVSNHLQVSFFLTTSWMKRDSTVTLASVFAPETDCWWKKAMHYEISDSEPWHVFSPHPFHITAYLGRQCADRWRSRMDANHYWHKLEGADEISWLESDSGP